MPEPEPELPDALEVKTAFAKCREFNAVISEWNIPHTMNISVMFLTIWWSPDRTDVFIWDEVELDERVQENI